MTSLRKGRTMNGRSPFDGFSKQRRTEGIGRPAGARGEWRHGPALCLCLGHLLATLRSTRRAPRGRRTGNAGTVRPMHFPSCVYRAKAKPASLRASGLRFRLGLEQQAGEMAPDWSLSCGQCDPVRAETRIEQILRKAHDNPNLLFSAKRLNQVV